VRQPAEPPGVAFFTPGTPPDALVCPLERALHPPTGVRGGWISPLDPRGPSVSARRGVLGIAPLGRHPEGCDSLMASAAGRWLTFVWVVNPASPCPFPCADEAAVPPGRAQ